MNTITAPRVLLSGASSRVGTEVLALGLTHVLRRRKIGVSCCLVEPHLQQATLFRRISGRYVCCLNRHLLSQSQILTTMYLAGLGADITVIISNRGLYDGARPGTSDGSDAEIAELTKSAVVLVADVSGMNSSIAALVKGYSESARGFEIGGLLLTHWNEAVQPEVHDQEYFKECLAHAKTPALLGLTPYAPALHTATFPHGTTQDKNYTALPRQFFEDAANLVAEYVDIDAFLTLAKRSSPVTIPEFDTQPRGRRTRIAVSDDACFNLCFQDNLELLRYYGAEIVTFSPLADVALPRDISGVYLSGAYLKEYGPELTKNKDIMGALRKFAEAGGLIYSEGGGTAYLCDSFQIDNAKNDFISGVGIIPAKAHRCSSKVQYNIGATVEDSILGGVGLTLQALHTNEWRIKATEALLKTVKLSSKDSAAYYEGYSPGPQIFSTLAFFHLGANHKLALNIVDAAEVGKKL